MTQTAKKSPFSMNVDLMHGPIFKNLLLFMLPIFISNLFQQLYNTVDTMIVGNVLGDTALAAIGSCGSIYELLVGFGLGIGNGLAIVAARSYGAQDHDLLKKTVAGSLVIGLVASLCITLAGVLGLHPLLLMLDTPAEILEEAYSYIIVIDLGVIVMFLYNLCAGLLRAIGNSVMPLMFLLISSALNVGLDLWFIAGVGMGVRGAALATIIGQIVTCILSALYFRKPKTFALDRRSFVLSGKISGRVLQLGVTSLVIQVAIVIVMSVANNMVGRYGPESGYGADIPLSVVGIVMKVFGIVIAFAVGIAVGGQPIVGYNYGAGNFSRVQETAKKILLADVVVGMIALLLFELCPQVIVRLFGSESDLYNQYANLCFRIFLSGIVLTCVQKAGSIFLQSIGKPVQSTLLSLSRDVIFFVPGLLLLTPAFGVEGMLWAAPVADVLAFAVTVLLVGRELKKMNLAEENIPLSTHKEEL